MAERKRSTDRPEQQQLLPLYEVFTRRPAPDGREATHRYRAASADDAVDQAVAAGVVRENVVSITQTDPPAA